jgi:hypothetical protein
MKKTIVMIIAIGSLLSCIKEVEITPENMEKKIVFSSIANPDSALKVNIRSTVSILDTSDGIIENASVLLYENGIIIDTLDYQNSGWYISSQMPSIGSEYEIVASSSLIEHSSKAKSTIPTSPQVISASHTIGRTLDSEQFPITAFSIEIEDDESTEDYYEILISESDPSSTALQIVLTSYYINIDDPSIVADGNWDYAPSSIYISDDLFNGNSKTLTLNRKWGQYQQDASGNYLPAVDYYATIRKISPSYFNYLRSWTVHQFNQNSTINTREPLTLLFQGDPVDLYTNVENGYGIFGAYNEVTVPIPFMP